MANYYKEINNMMEKIINKILVLEKGGIGLGIKKDKFSFLEMQIIKKVGKDKSKSISDLIKETDIDRGIITLIVNKLVLGGYFKKEKSNEDKRVSILMLTEEGNNIYTKIINQQKELLDFVLGDISLNEEKTILKFLSKINQSKL